MLAHTAHRYRIGGTGTRGIGLRDLLAGKDEEPGANGEFIPADKRVARGHEVIPGHFRHRPPSSSAPVPTRASAWRTTDADGTVARPPDRLFVSLLSLANTSALGRPDPQALGKPPACGVEAPVGAVPPATHALLTIPSKHSRAE